MIESFADINVNSWLVIGGLYFICLLCFLAMICKNFHENWLQWFGLGGVIVWALGRADRLMDRIDDGKDTVNVYFLILVVSMIVYGIGTGWKVWQHREK